MRRRFLAAILLAVLGVTSGLPVAAQPLSPEADEAQVPFAQTTEAAPPAQSLEELGEEVAVTDATGLPAPQPGAEAYPVPADGIYRVTGGGFGHRIGMSQWGAHGAGLQGRTHEQILDFYYPGTRVETRPNRTLRVGITIDNDGTTQVSHRTGLRVGAAPGGTTYALPEGRSQWRVRATGSAATSCVLEGYNGSSWSAYWPAGLSRRCPITFSSPGEGTVDLRLPGGSPRVYRGAVTATHTGSATLTTVNHLPMQQYLRSVVAAEMGPSFHPEALGAQAVAARTYAERSQSASSYDICDTTWCQAYRGRGQRNTDGTITSYEYGPNTTAVDATAGKVLTFAFPNGRRLATTMYSASTGGQTIASGNGHDYLRAQVDPYDSTAANPRHRWNAQLPVSALQQRYGIHRVERVQVLTRDGVGAWGGRVLTARVEGFTSDGRYTYAHATGSGLMQARYWPTWSTGLSSDYFTLGTPAEDPAPDGPVRLAGTDRYGTAARVATQWPSGLEVVYVVSGMTYPDALAASARAGTYDAPVVLVRPDGIPGATAQALSTLRPNRLVIVGGDDAVQADVRTELRGYARSGVVDRVAGTDRYGTAAALSGYYPAGVARVVLTSGQDFPDALSGAAVANGQGVPLLLTRQGELPGATVEALRRLRPREVVVIGGTEAVSAAAERQAAGLATQGSRRLSGTSRYDTAQEVAATFPRDTDPAVVALGSDFPDALAGAALAGRSDAPIVLTPGDRVHGGTGQALRHLRPSQMYVVGGTGAIPDTVLRTLGDYLR